MLISEFNGRKCEMYLQQIRNKNYGTDSIHIGLTCTSVASFVGLILNQKCRYLMGMYNNLQIYNDINLHGAHLICSNVANFAKLIKNCELTYSTLPMLILS